METLNKNKAINKKHLLNKIREYNFALVETALFLDTHPNCKKALMYYSKIKEGHENAIKEYEKMFGPLNMYSSNNNNRWNWIDGPWPWEGEC